jgi:hypothetical protein
MGSTDAAADAPGPTAGPGLLRVVVASIAASLAAAVVVVFIMLGLEDAFRRGATASGLNPEGGAPGVLILGPPALAAWLVARALERRGLLPRLDVATIAVVLGAGVQVAVMLMLGRAMLGADFPPLEPFASGAAFAWGVPLAVTAVLSGL